MKRAMIKKHELIQAERGQKATPIHLVNKDSFPGWLKTLSGPQRTVVEAQKFTGGSYETAIVPDSNSWFAVGGVANPDDLSSWCMAKLAEILPAGTYIRAAGEPGPALHGWQAAQYRFTRYKPEKDPVGPRILLTRDAAAIDAARAEALAVCKVRDLVNTPAEDMGPAALEDEIVALGKAFRAEVNITMGDTLETEFPMVHAVGRAATRHHAPRMLELVWGDEKAPRLAIIGKGVSFDSGGLDIKSAAGMKLMKKDMGGAAHALALAGLVMGAGLKLRLHLLVPAVENAISANAFRPGDVLKSRKGLTVEIGNTDAEGRLILADALARASEDRPDLMLDFATLTGAARVALGPDLPALMARRDETADALVATGRSYDDRVWPLPLHDAYAEFLKSDIADTNNAHGNPFAGAIVAGLFLEKFVEEGLDWVHFDTFAWRATTRPGRPAGGDALGLRAAWHMIRQRFG